MKTIRHLPETTSISRQSFQRLAMTLALALSLLVGAPNSHAAIFTWTNTVGDVWGDTNAWSPTTGLPGNADNATFSGNTSFTVQITNSIALDGIDIKDTKQQVITLDTRGNTITLFHNGTGQPTALTAGDPGSSTAIVYIVSSTTPGTLIVTNTGNARITAGRSGNGTILVSNMTVIVGAGLSGNNSVIEGNSAGPASQGHIIITGSTTYWTNNASFNVGNNASAASNTLVISSGASMTCVGAFTTGTGGAGGSSVLIDSGARLFTLAAGTTIGTTTGNGCSVTVRNGAVWDLNNTALPIGATGTGNSLTIGATGTVQSVSAATIASGNSLILAGGLLSVSTTLTDNSGTISGFGAVAGNILFTGNGTLTPGSGSTVGTIVASNNLTLVSSATTIIKLDKGQVGSNDLLSVTGALTEAGTLTINNVGAALVGGDTFQIFTAGSVSGNFSVTNLPSLGAGLSWNTSLLGAQGIISVVLAPSITGPAGQAVLPGSNVVISAVVTGVPVPSLQWTFQGTNLIGDTSNSITLNNVNSNDNAGVYCLIASNYAGSVTNCMILTVCDGGCPPTITGPTDQTVIQGNNGTFAASVAGLPFPTIQWQQNGVDIPGATDVPLVLTNVQYSQDGHVYSVIASNEAGSVTNQATLHVIVAPVITQQPTNYTVTVGQSVTFTVLASGVPTPTYQWYFKNNPIGGATSATYTIASVTAANAGSYYAVAINAAGTAPSGSATLTVLSTMTAASLTPANTASNICYDTPLYITFSQAPLLRDFGKVRIYNVNNPATPVDTLDMTQNFTNNTPYAVDIQARTIGTEIFNTYPVIITGNTAAIYPHLGVLSSNQTYFVTVDQGLFTDTTGALFAGITSTNAWVFSTKPTGPVNPNNLTVAADGSGDFLTVQGAVDSLPSGNTTYTLVNIRNGTYTEIVDTRNKNNITFRGQSRAGTVVGYYNNNNMNGSTHFRMAFKIYANNLAIENMTVVNTTPQGGSQAEALMLESGAVQFILNNAEVDSRQDTIYANGTPQSQGYFYNSFVQGNFDYVWGSGDLFFTNCQFQTIPTASTYNLGASRTDNGTSPGGWLGPDGRYASNGIAFVNCLLTRSSSTVSNITMSDSNGNPDGLTAWISCSIDTSNGNGYVTPAPAVLASQILWEYANSNLNNSAAAPLGLTVLTNGDARLQCVSSATCWLYGWQPQLAPNILTNPVSMTVTAGTAASFNVVATGIPSPSYQWLLNGTNIVGATDATLTFNAYVSDGGGVYSVIVSNAAGTITSAGATLSVVGTPPTASFTANPSTGDEPLIVTFTDTSTGTKPLALTWDFGDGGAAETVGGASVTHAYAAGTYTVTMTASNLYGLGTSTATEPNLVVVVNPEFEGWQQQYFGCTNCPEALPSADPYGKGMLNVSQYLAGFDPTNTAAYLHVISIAKTNGTDVNVIFLGASGDSTYVPGVASRTNRLEYTTGAAGGSYNNAFTAVPGVPDMVLSGGTGLGAVTNFTEAGGATNVPSRFYRVRVLLP
ncbi:MAG TPA: pectinesterase family protein [Verrucomicrobiae bacterium]|nr:pectinesterase family protein [Verrucomicrobiae bacterium]